MGVELFEAVIPLEHRIAEHHQGSQAGRRTETVLWRVRPNFMGGCNIGVKEGDDWEKWTVSPELVKWYPVARTYCLQITLTISIDSREP